MKILWCGFGLSFITLQFLDLLAGSLFVTWKPFLVFKPFSHVDIITFFWFFYSGNLTKPPPAITFKDEKIVQIGEEVSLTAELPTKHHGNRYDEKFIAAENCRATPDENFNSTDGITLIENG